MTIDERIAELERQLAELKNLVRPAVVGWKAPNGKVIAVQTVGGGSGGDGSWFTTYHVSVEVGP